MPARHAIPRRLRVLTLIGAAGGPARRKRNKRVAVSMPFSKKRAVLIIILLLVLTVVGLLVRSFLSYTENYFVIAEALDSGDLKVSYIDLVDKQEFVINIPKDTQVVLARQRGVLRASSIKKLLDSENLDKQMLADTVTKTFYFPSDYWRVGNSTDLPLSLRIRLALARLAGTTSEEINLEDTAYLVSEKLPDGDEGYTVRDNMPLLLQSVFADPYISKERLAVQVLNSTGAPGYYLNDVAKILEVLGVKVAPISDQQESEVDCLVRSLNRRAGERIAQVFNCRYENSQPSAFDMDIVIGKEFGRRF